jgi:nicotinamide phosphoribosyltransferase
VIQGDGVDFNTISALLWRLGAMGYAADNIAFGMGGALLQKVDRDTFSFAMKCSAVEVDGYWVDVYKEPITQSSKNSKRGKLSLYHDGDDFFTVNRKQFRDLPLRTKMDAVPVLETVFENGVITKLFTFDQVRANTGKELGHG